RRSLANRTTNSVAKCAASEALPPLPQTSNLFPARKHCSIIPAARAISGSIFFKDCSVSIEPSIACSRVEEKSDMRRMLREKGGARYRVRTCDPYRVKVVLYH